MKLAIIGSRNINNLNISQYIKQRPDFIISGGAKGIDSLAVEYAKENNIQTIVHKPNYKRYSRGATHVRNNLIISDADKVLAFWDGISPGTKWVFLPIPPKRCTIYLKTYRISCFKILKPSNFLIMPPISCQ
jgi:hypothetical protein